MKHAPKWPVIKNADEFKARLHQLIMQTCATVTINELRQATYQEFAEWQTSKPESYEEETDR